ncbi:MAG: CIA30 family protein [Bacteroidota bacterium]
MKYLLLASLLLSVAPMKISFTEVSQWYILNDGVMGGLSQGKAQKTDDGMLFSGTVSLANNGGFSSFRSPWKDYDLSGYEEVTIKYRSEGIKQALVMETDRRWWIPNFKVSLPNTEGWETKTFQLSSVKEYRLGNPTGNGFDNASREDIIRLGFITDEKREGDFRFEVASVEFK